MRTLLDTLRSAGAAAIPGRAAANCPPRPRPLPAVAALVRVLLRGDGDLLSLLPAKAYRVDTGWLGWSRRSMLIVNAPELVREVLRDHDAYPKSDLMVDALEPLVGDSMFVSSGDTWRRQRRMIDPAFSQLRLGRAFEAMTAAVDDYETRLDAVADGTAPAPSLDLAMSQLTADVICRAVFSTSLRSQTARDVFEAFTVFEKSVAQVRLKTLILDPAWTRVPQAPEVLAACGRIRGHLGELLDTHVGGGAGYDDIATAIVGARDPESGAEFDRKELLDQLGVMFLAGHETTASGLTWAFLLLSMRPDVLARLRAEVDAVAGDGPVGFEHTKRLPYVRAVFREALRLYPPITFIPRVAARAGTLGGRQLKRGAMLMIAPWTIHRHERYWRRADEFDPERFLPEREGEIVPGTYLPFGIGPRVCVGASFAQTEATLILARLARRYDFEVPDAARVRPVARLTTRPAEELRWRVRRREPTGAGAGGAGWRAP